MIVTTKRTYLNILTQLIDAQTLINATYFMADQTTKDGNAMLQEQVTVTDDGRHVIEPLTMTSAKGAFSRFHVFYTEGVLSPDALNSQIMAGILNDNIDQAFRQSLTTVGTMQSVYREMYANPTKGNGLRFLIYRKEQSIPYIHHVCEFLSQAFGEDIQFVEPGVRRGVPGKEFYPGNRQQAYTTIAQIRESILMDDLASIVAAYTHGHSGSANLENYFSGFEGPELIYIYEKLFPMDPLTPGNYTKENMLEIIIGKIKASAPQAAQFENLHTLTAMCSDYDGISDDELMALQGY